MKTRRIVAFAVLLGMVAGAWASPPEKRARRSKIDNLREQLVAVEASLEELDQQLDRGDHRQKRSEARIENSQKANELLNRQPAWYWDASRQEFQHAPTVARDPFAANDEVINREREKIKRMSSDKKALQSMRVELEVKQGELWARIAAAVIDQRGISDKRQEYHFVPGIASTDASSKEKRQQQAEVAGVLIRYLRFMDAAVKDFDKAVRTNPAGAYEALLKNAEAAYETLSGELLRLPSDVIARADALRQYAKDLQDSAEAMSESCPLAKKARGGIDHLKPTQRKQLREGSVALASLILDLDDGILELCEEWKVRPQLEKPLVIPAIVKADRAAPQKNDEERETDATDDPAEETVKQADDHSKAGKRIDLLAKVDVRKDVVRGKWTRVGSGIKSDGYGIPYKGGARLAFHYAPKGEYDFLVSFTRESGIEYVELFLCFRGRTFAWCMGSGKNTLLGFELVDGVEASNRNPTIQYRPGVLNNGQLYKVRVKVRSNSLEAYLDDVLVGQFKGDFSRLSTNPARDLGTVSLGLHSFQSPTTFHSAEVIEYGSSRESVKAKNKGRR